MNREGLEELFAPFAVVTVRVFVASSYFAILPVAASGATFLATGAFSI